MNTTTTIRTEDVERFVEVFAAGDVADDVGPFLSCVEVEALAGLFRAIGETAAAERWIRSHATADEEGDQHALAAVEEYVVPIDPMDDLQCDSCQ